MNSRTGKGKGMLVRLLGLVPVVLAVLSISMLVEVGSRVLALKKVWEFIVGFARRADAEWRIVISKLGVMGETELTGLCLGFQIFYVLFADISFIQHGRVCCLV